MASTADIKGSTTPSILVIGDGGTGKSRFLASCPKPFVFDFDKGLVSTKDLPAFEYETFKDEPWSTKGIPLAVQAERKKQGFSPWGTSWTRFINYLDEKVEPKMGDSTLPYDTLGIDSLTTLTSQCMNYVLKTASKTGETSPTLPEWGSQLRLLETLMEQLAAWPIRLIVNAHIKRDDNLVMGEKEFLPMITGQLASRLGIYFDEVYYTEVKGAGKDRKFHFRTEASGLYKQAKSRANVPSGIEAKWSALAPYFTLTT